MIPNGFGYGGNQLEFPPLLFFGQWVAASRGGKAALRAERKLLQRNVLRSFLDLPHYLMSCLEITVLGCN
jgi:hypothetical protein